MKKFTEHTKYIELEPKFYPVINSIVNSRLRSLSCFTQVSDAYAILVVSGRKTDVEALYEMMRLLSIESKKLTSIDDAGIIYWASQVAGSHCGLYFSSQEYDKEFAPNKRQGLSLGAKVVRRMLSD